ncbi:HAD-IIB family hydrolase [Mycoplasmopsis lipofaciens]|uniref:HAD-IIB family hydrolase n=1 Tax=Mycoplasmopsis lipofaciens TaxID=114884 RepID=UPI0004883BD1|nr:HAD-IIB family hydrolase [Mycoplasmopsis lipofaciens]
MDQERLTYFIDLDGTLFDQNKKVRISDRNTSAILLLKNFANVIISTGRSFSDQRTQQALYQLRLTDVIASSGAQIFIDNKLAWSKLISDEIMLKIVEFAKKRKLMFVIFDNNGENMYTHNWLIYVINKIFFSKKLYSIKMDYKFNIKKHNNISKVAFILKSNKSYKTILEEFRLLFSEYTNSFSASGNYVIEITAKEANKGLAIVEYCKLKNIPLNTTIHIGDSQSDAVVKGYANKLVAMGNATNDLKAIADEIAPNYKKYGIYKYFININKQNKNEEVKDD